MTEPKPTSSRFALRFSLRTLLILTLVVAAFFGGRVSMQPAIVERDQIIQANARKLAQLERESQSEVGKLHAAFKMELDEVERNQPETEFDDYLRRYSAGKEQFFLGPLPDEK
jgi:hypothetical protein